MPIVLKRSKRYKASAEKSVKFTTPVSIDDAIDAVKSFNPTKFDQSVELIFNLGIDTKQVDQAIRSSVSLPHGIGKAKRVIAFCGEHLVEPAKAAGAIRAGGQDLVQEIEKTNFTDFDVAIASPDMMRFVGRLGKVLGPKGLMPSPKAGTVTPDVANAVKEYAAGKVEFRADAGGNVHSVVGKMSFDKPKLHDNIQAMINTIRRLKPQTSKGAYFKKVVLKGSMTPAVMVNVQQCLPEYDMSKRVKNLIERDLGNKLKDVESVAVINPRGINATKNNLIRRRLHEKGLRMTVVKNTLVKRATAKSAIAGFDKLLDGPSAVIYGQGSISAIARLLMEEKKNDEKIELRGIFFGGEIYPGEKGVEQVSKLPTREEAIGQIVALLVSPGKNLAGAITGPGKKLASIIKAIEEKAEKASGAAAPAPAA